MRLLLLLLLISCSAQPVKINYSDGRSRYLLTCEEHMSNCHLQAAKLCPHGHTVTKTSWTKKAEDKTTTIQQRVACKDEKLVELKNNQGTNL